MAQEADKAELVTPEMLEGGMIVLLQNGWRREQQTLDEAADMLEAIYTSMAANAPRG